jgi:hypothetical protein
MKSEGRIDMHLSSLANIGVKRMCHSIIPTSQYVCRGNLNWMLAEACFCMGAKADSRAGLQTYDMFASTWLANYDMFASGATRIARLAKHMIC